MRLTEILYKKLPKGNIYTGKNRIVKKVDAEGLRKLRHDYEREENNMLLLRHAYLTPQQSHGHMQAMGRPSGRKLDWEAEKIAKFTKVITLEDRLMHLRVQDVWD